MILALDIGNTNITIGVYDKNDLKFVSRMATDRSRMEDQYAIELRDILDIYGVSLRDIEGAIISSVVPTITKYIRRAIRKLMGVEALCVGPETKTNLKISIDPPNSCLLYTSIAKGYGLILTSHYTPEDLKDAAAKIRYLENLKTIAASCTDADAFKEEAKKQYPGYSGENYLNMTAGFFFA